MAWIRLTRSVRTLMFCGMVTGGLTGVTVSAMAADSPVIAAASSLNPALNEIRRSFEVETGHSLRLSYGSSGNIARQIIRGAPFELFLSADERYVQTLVERAFTTDDGDLYAVGGLVLFVPQGAPIRADKRLQNLERALTDGTLRRLAIANPEHAPYGRAARQLLQTRGLWDRLGGKLVMGENIAQAAQFAVTGSVDAAILSQSMVLSPALAHRGRFAVVPQAWHDPVRHRMVLLKGAGQTAVAFYSFLRGPVAREILQRYGFSTPVEAAP